MSKFKKKKAGDSPGISTASLPDIVFMLLFFFMVTTVMKETELLVSVQLPKASEVTKIERKDLVGYIYVGKPLEQYTATMGTEARIQLDDAFAGVDEIIGYVAARRDAILDENERKQLTMSIKGDGDAKMGLITDIKQELREAQAYKLNYSTLKEEVSY